MNYDYEPFQNLSNLNFKRKNPSQSTFMIQNLQFEDLYNFKTNFQPFQVQEIMQSFNIDDLINDKQALNDFLKMSELQKKRKKLTSEEKNLFKWIFMKLYEILPFSIDLIPTYIWHKISSLLNRPLDQLEELREKIEKKTIYQFPWSQDEDLNLQNIVSKQRGSNYKIKWKKVSEELKLQAKTQYIRLPRQCRERWINHLNPDLNKKAWTQMETIQLIDLVKEKGKKWSQIARKLNRNDNQKKLFIRKTRKQKENSINSYNNYFIEQTCSPDLNTDYEFGFVNPQTKTLYLFDQGQFLIILKRMDSIYRSYAFRASSEQDFFSPFYSDNNFENEVNTFDKSNIMNDY